MMIITNQQEMVTFEAKVDERGIWLPSGELKRGIGKYIDRLNRKADLTSNISSSTEYGEKLL